MRFDSRDTVYKTPFGAVRVGENIHLTFPVSEEYYVHSIVMHLRGVDGVRDVPLTYDKAVGGYHTFTADFCVQESGVYYYMFEISTQKGTLYAGRDSDGRAVYGEWQPEWQLTVYEGVSSTAIVGEVVYHVFVDRFNRARYAVLSDKPVTGVWGDKPSVTDDNGVYGGKEFFGGNLKGITEKLDYIRALGVGVIYLSPIFESESNHRYDTGDYMRIDSLIGTDEDFRELTERAGEMGIKVILDGVFNHSGSNSRYFNKHGDYDTLGAYQSESSPYRDWYFFENGGYRSWWGIQNVPTLNKSARGYVDLVMGDGGVIDKWMGLGAYGWRLDVVDELDDTFLQVLVDKIRSVSPDSPVIGEVWEDASTKEAYGVKRRYFTHGQLNGVTNYPFRNAIIAYVMGGSPIEFARTVMDIADNYPMDALNTCMTILSTHDTERIVNALSGAYLPDDMPSRYSATLTESELALGRTRQRLAVALQYVLPGLPTLYYGDEVGMTGFGDPMNRATFPWGEEDTILLDYYVRMGRLREEKRDILTGSVRMDVCGDLLVIVRERDGEHITTYANNTSSPIPLPRRLHDIFTGEDRDEVDGGSFVITDE